MAYLNNYTSSSSTVKSSRGEIEFLFHKILSPIKKSPDPNLIFQFCQKLNDIEDTQQAADLIVSKLLSTQDWEVLIALYVLEACVKNCGEPMHEIIGRFRFLNEMIKLISPKYFGSRTSEASKKKCIELIYCWSRDLPKKTKIKEAYEMIKKQGIVTQDPVDVEDLHINVAPRQKNGNSSIEDDEKAKQLARLLKSKNPQDLEMANKLIKSMVKQDEIKTEKISERINELEKINNNIKLLNEMLSEYDSNTAKSSEKETIKYLYDELEKLQPNLIRLATETDDNDESIGDILKTNDACETTLKKYHRVFDHKFSPDDALVNLNSAESVSNTESKNVESSNKNDSTKDLQDLFSNTNLNELYSKPDLINVNQNSTSNILDDLFTVPSSNSNLSAADTHNNLLNMNTSLSLNSLNQPVPLQPMVPKTESNNSLKNTTNTHVNKPVESKPFDDLNELSKALMGDSLNFTTEAEKKSIKAQKINDIIKASNSTKNETNNLLNTNGNLITANNENNPNKIEDEKALVFERLNYTFVELETIKPSMSIPPLNLYDKNNLKIVLHFARDSPSNHINAVVVSTTNMNMQSEMKNFLFQVAVTKNMRVRLQPASRSDLPAYNPILPITAITQIMLIANPLQEQVRLKYKISYSYDGKQYEENNEVKNFPRLVDSLI